MIQGEGSIPPYALDVATELMNSNPSWPGGANDLANKLLEWTDGVYVPPNGELWSANDFENSLKDIIYQQKQLRYNKNYIVKITPKQKTDFIIFGDLQ